MEFRNQAQNETYGKVLEWLTEIFGERVHKHDELPWLRVSTGGATVIVMVMEWGGDDAIICSRSIVAQDVEVTPELMKFLLGENTKLTFGAFGMEDGEITFDHVFYGTTCDKEEIRHSIEAVLRTAVKYEYEIISRWGGKRITDDRS